MENKTAKAMDLINECVEYGILDEGACIAVVGKPKNSGKERWIWIPKEKAAEDIVKQNAFGILENALKEAKVEKLVYECLKTGILRRDSEGVYPMFSPNDGEEIRWATKEEAAKDVAKQETWIDAVTYNTKSEEYLKAMLAAKEYCLEKFPELHEMVFSGKDYNLIFSHDPDRHFLYYFNPDSSAGGQIITCPFDDDMALRIANGEDLMDVLAEVTQYLSDINTVDFFDTLYTLIQDHDSKAYIGCDRDTDAVSLIRKITAK